LESDLFSVGTEAGIFPISLHEEGTSNSNILTKR
jgi:hypothetical protein